MKLLKKWPLIVALVGGTCTLAVGLFYLLAVYSNVLPVFLRQPAPPPARTQSREAQWTADLDYYAAQMKRLHADPFHRISEVEFDETLTAIKQQINDMSDQQISMQIIRLTAAIGDGHTQALPAETLTFHFYPIFPYWFDDGIYILRAAPDYSDLVGSRLLAINGMPVEEVAARVSPYVSHDNQSALKYQIWKFLISPEFLQAADVLAVGQMETFLTLINEQGETFEKSISPLTDMDYSTLLLSNDILNRMYYRAERNNEPYWFEYLSDSKILYIQYNRCEQNKNLAMDYFAEQVAEAIKSQPAEKLIVDLRRNGGGDSSVISPLLKTISASRLNAPGKLYVLVGTETFSSAILNTVDFAQQTQALFAGSVPAGKIGRASCRERV